METKAAHVFVGLFTLLAIALGVGFALWLARANVEREYDFYDVVFTEPVSGLSESGRVEYNGIKVGEVFSLRLNPEDPSEVLARIRVVEDTPIRKDTGAKLSFQGLTGIAFIQLFGGSSESPSLREVAESSVPTIVADVSDLQRLLSSGEDVAVSVGGLIERAQELLADENLERVQATLAHIEAFSSQLTLRGEELGEVMATVERSSAEVPDLLASINQVIASLENLSVSEIPSAIEALELASRSADRSAEEIALLVSSNRTGVSESINEFNSTMRELRFLARGLNRLSERLVAYLGDRAQDFQP